MFLNLFGQRLSEQLLSGLVRQLIRRANPGKTGSCHLFRHAFATGLLRNGCDLRHIQTMLGHASLETTQLYTHLDTGQIQAAHQRFHPGHRSRLACGITASLETLMNEARSLGEKEVGKAIDYVRLLRIAHLHDAQQVPPLSGNHRQ